MKNNTLIVILSKLDRKEMTRFEAFARSPYFNKHKDVIALVGYLSQIYPHFSEKKCDREVIFQHLYPALPHRQQQLAIIFTYALRLLEQFLVLEQWRQAGEIEDKTLYSKALRSRDLLFLIKNNTEGKAGGGRNGAGKSSGPAGIPQAAHDSQAYLQLARQAAEADQVAMQLGQTGSRLLDEKNSWLDAFYLTEKLKDACEWQQRKVLLKIEQQEDPILRPLLEFLDAHVENFGSFPPVIVYFRLCKLLIANEIKSYHATLAGIRQLEHFLPKETRQNVFNYLQNFCIQQINSGNQEFLRELFELYRYQLEKELLLVNGYLPEWHFKNIVTTGLRLDEHAWVRQFLENYRDSLHPEVRENAYSYNLAAFFYHLKNYEEVLRLLLSVEYTDLRYHLDAKSLLLRTYYDLEEEEALLSLTEAFRQFLKRNKSLSEFQKQGYFNLLRFTRLAFRLKMTKGFVPEKKWEADRKKLQAGLTSAETVFNQSWLKRVAAELENW